MAITLRIIGFVGLVIFGTLLSLTLLSSEKIESSAKGFVKHQIEKEVTQKQQSILQSIQQTTLANKAVKLVQQLTDRSANITQQLENDLPERVATIIASMCGYDCERKKEVKQSITNSLLKRLNAIEAAQLNLKNIVRGKYLEILEHIKRDLRIFLGSNLVMFLALLLISFSKPKANIHLFLPGILLTLTTIISSSIYIFGQDWFYTILYNDFMGLAYPIYVIVIFSALSDIVFNRAKIITRIINFCGNAISAIPAVIPC